MRIAALDDEPCQLELIRHTMEDIGHECHSFSEGKVLLRDLRQQSYDLLILDWSLPDVDGPRVVRWIRDDLNSRIPILFVTNRHEEADMVEGLAAGADDFMVKPIRVGELQARVRALLRRSYPALHGTDLTFGDYQFSAATHTLRIRGQAAELSHREYDLAFLMFQNMGRLLSREHIREAIWGEIKDSPSRTLDTHISRLRGKLDLVPSNGFLLSAVYGLGYRLECTGGDPLDPLSPLGPLTGDRSK
ncbi:response regulator transcription factor [Variovorax sp. Sphag1AA]|uniref:response regulator transcription factor n=1 Tax=Variovorax sp. Sphag1AA TaxID=2587027 RepID=UPI0016116552|nr:response regulator transcription factor [Variovorax sp. Sphag1AA]MBB3180658.1 DNA-binding response OmpR family regulator [Variovorax sp. Sphag1AA]